MKTVDHAERVVLCVLDGLRPDMADATLCPHLHTLLRHGTLFYEARSVFPSVTRVATASLATGRTPAGHGVLGNLFRPPGLAEALDTGRSDSLLAAEVALGRRFPDAPGIGDCLAAAGRSMAVVHVGKAGGAHLLNPRAAEHGHWSFAIEGRNASPTPAAWDEAVAWLGEPPPGDLPNLSRMTWATALLTEVVLPQLRPDLAILWLNEPDLSGHFRRLGSANTRNAVQHADTCLGWLRESLGEDPRTLLIVASDHGQVTAEGITPLLQALPTALPGLAPGSIAATGGAAGEIRLRGGGAREREDLAAWLMDRPDIGHVFSASRNQVEGEIAGTFGFDLLGIGHPSQADLVYVLAGDAGCDAAGFPGRRLVTGGVPVGGGAHGGLLEREMRSLLAVSGPGFSHGLATGLACGIIDIAPTILAALGLPSAPGMRGRDLARALREGVTDGPRRLLEVRRRGFAQRLELAGPDGRYIMSGVGRALPHNFQGLQKPWTS